MSFIRRCSHGILSSLSPTPTSPLPTAHIYIDLTKPLFICPGAKQSIPIAGVGAGVEADLFCGTAAGPQ
jgi:hypothetical protein